MLVYAEGVQAFRIRISRVVPQSTMQTQLQMWLNEIRRLSRVSIRSPLCDAGCMSGRSKQNDCCYIIHSSIHTGTHVTPIEKSHWLKADWRLGTGTEMNTQKCKSLKADRPKSVPTLGHWDQNEQTNMCKFDKHTQQSRSRHLGNGTKMNKQKWNKFENIHIEVGPDAWALGPKRINKAVKTWKHTHQSRSRHLGIEATSVYTGTHRRAPGYVDACRCTVCLYN